MLDDLLKIIVTCKWKVVVDAFKISTTFFVCVGQQKGFGDDRKYEIEALKKFKRGLSNSFPCDSNPFEVNGPRQSGLNYLNCTHLGYTLKG